MPSPLDHTDKVVETYLHAYADHLRTRTMGPNATARIARAIREEAQRTQPHPKHARHRHLALRAACIALALTVGAGAIALWNQGVDADPGAFPSDETDSVTSPLSGGNFFTLKAWADEAPMADNAGAIGQSVALGAPYLLLGSWSGGDDSGYAVDIQFDDSCEGTNLSSLTYELQSEQAFLEYRDMNQWLAAHGEGDRAGACETWSEGFTQSLTIDLDRETDYTRTFPTSPEPRKDAPAVTIFGKDNDVQTSLRLDLSPNETLKELDEAVSASDDYDPAAWSALACELYYEAAQQLDQSVLKITATFTDGTTQSNAYRISPVADFKDVYPEYEAAKEVAFADGAVEIDYSTLPALFTLTLVDAS